ncbi:MAG: hypothetical protein AAB787_02220, partial [Patescibacteria group bacterium]
MNKKLKIVSFFIMGMVFIFLPTKYNVVSYNITTCEGVLGPMWDLMYIFEFITIAWIIGLCLKRYNNMAQNDEYLARILHAGIGVVSFLVLFALSNVFGEIFEIQEISFIGSLGLLSFLGFLSYMIVRYKTFNIRVLGAQALVIVLWIMIGSLIFVVQSYLTKIGVAA